MKFILPELGIQQLDDWYSVSSGQLESLGYQLMIVKHGGFQAFLKKFYPNHPWDFTRYIFEYANVIEVE